jgi:hypothetical protein
MYLASTSVRWTYIAVLCIVAEDAASEGWLEAPIEWWEQATNSENIVQDLQFLANAGLILLENLDPTYLSSTRQVRAKYTTSTDVCSKCALEKEKEREKEKEKEEDKYRTSQSDTPPPPAKAKRSRSKVQVMDLSDDELALGTKWLKYAVHHYPAKVTDQKWTPDSFALELRKVATAIGYSVEQMSQLCDSIAGDTFWCNKAASPFGLLKKSDNGLRKIENAIAGSKSRTQVKNEQLAAKWDANPQEKADMEDGLAMLHEALERRRSRQR